MKDLARIYIKAGDGGDGSAHLRHEKYAPKGGPDGGDGGKGGDVILIADENVENLVEFNFKKRFIAKSGERGSEKRSSGKSMENIYVKVPVGTVVYEIPKDYFEANLRSRENFEEAYKVALPVADMDSHGKVYEAAWGGKGGKGNFHFKSSTNQTPRNFEPGQPGDEKYLLLELKVVADVGIVGLPNVGKSSLLKALTRANPKIAGYPFTTLEPNLGVASINEKKVVLVDVPGVVEEAWEGKGIGPWFLRHLERVGTLVHVLAPRVDESGEMREENIASQLVNDYKIVRKELEKYGKNLPVKKEIVVVNKRELVDSKEHVLINKKFAKETGKELIWVSAASNEVGELTSILQGSTL